MSVKSAAALLALIAGLALTVPAAASAQPTFGQTDAAQTTGAPPPGDTAFDSKARAINVQLRCPVCQGSSIQESPSAEAIAMKAIVRERLAKGESEEQIKAYFVSRYGDWILLAPPAHGINLLVYILPVIVLLAGGFFVYRTAKTWTTAS